MQGVEIAHLNASFEAALKAFHDFEHSTVEDALRPISRYGKKDTLGMDSGPEITICEMLSRYDNGAVVVTEEAGLRGISVNDSFKPNDPQSFRTVFLSDPTDRSNQLKAFLGQFLPKTQIGQILGTKQALDLWQKSFSGPASITGATSAISCVRRGIPIFSVIINYITRELFVSCAAGNRVVRLPQKRTAINLAYILTKGLPVNFPGIDRLKTMRNFVTFLGDAGKVGYRENFDDSNFMSLADAKSFLHYGKPGGPSRILYLSSIQPKSDPIGFVLANGEKIGEWIHWLPFIQYARSEIDDSMPALHMYEVYQDRPWTKEGVLMSTPPNYSLFREYNGKMYVDTSWLLRMPNPSQLRSTLIVAPFDNRWVLRTSSQSGFRRIRF